MLRHSVSALYKSAVCGIAGFLLLSPVGAHAQATASLFLTDASGSSDITANVGDVLTLNLRVSNGSQIAAIGTNVFFEATGLTVIDNMGVAHPAPTTGTTVFAPGTLYTGGGTFGPAFDEIRAPNSYPLVPRNQPALHISENVGTGANVTVGSTPLVVATFHMRLDSSSPQVLDLGPVGPVSGPDDFAGYSVVGSGITAQNILLDVHSLTINGGVVPGPEAWLVFGGGQGAALLLLRRRRLGRAQRA